MGEGERLVVGGEGLEVLGKVERLWHGGGREASGEG